MTRVDFYVLPSSKSPQHFACLLTQKAWQQGHSVYLHTGSREAAKAMDELLWTFRDISFLPHALADESETDLNRISIGWDSDHWQQQEILINLSADLPPQCSGPDRIIELVGYNDSDRQNARYRYRGYRDKGFELHNHKIEEDHERR